MKEMKLKLKDQNTIQPRNHNKIITDVIGAGIRRGKGRNGSTMPQSGAEFVTLRDGELIGTTL